MVELEELEDFQFNIPENATGVALGYYPSSDPRYGQSVITWNEGSEEKRYAIRDEDAEKMITLHWGERSDKVFYSCDDCDGMWCYFVRDYEHASNRATAIKLLNENT